ncbi:MAG TPA: peptidoglycan-associated lipoprotein Pal [Thermoanaerobaculia bacterium]
MLRTFLVSLVVMTIVLVPACRTRKTPPPVTNTMATDTGRPPDIDIPPPVATDTATTVAPTEDFVRDEQPAEEALPSDIEALNQMAQSRGFIRDAFFNYDEATLDSEAQANLTATADWLRRNPQYNLLVEGHCDERGTEQYNLALGDRRANSARDFLLTLGIDAGRIRTVSYGEERPFETGRDDSAMAQNRRAHLVLVR